jgi:hypothetical protein
MSFKQMVRLAALLGAIVIPLAAYAQQGRWAAPGDETAQSLINMERQWAEAACDGNLAMQAILADDFQGTAPNGTRYPKAQEIQETKTSKHEAHGCRLGDTKVHFFGDNLAIIYGAESRIQKASDDKEYTRSLVWTDTWLKRNGSWQIVAAHDATYQASAQGASTAQDDSKVQTSTEDRLVGTWRLVSAGTFRKDGAFEPYPEYGPNPRGYLMYDSTGHMCVSLANPDHPRWANAEKPTNAEKVRSYDVFFSYCGTYEVREKEGRVIHRPEMGSWPHYIGTDQNRNFRLEGDRLILSSEETPPNGEHRRYQITWQRIIKRDQ